MQLFKLSTCLSIFQLSIFVTILTIPNLVFSESENPKKEDVDKIHETQPKDLEKSNKDNDDPKTSTETLAKQPGQQASTQEIAKQAIKTTLLQGNVTQLTEFLKKLETELTLKRVKDKEVIQNLIKELKGFITKPEDLKLIEDNVFKFETGKDLAALKTIVEEAIQQKAQSENKPSNNSLPDPNKNKEEIEKKLKELEAQKKSVEDLLAAIQTSQDKLGQNQGDDSQAGEGEGSGAGSGGGNNSSGSGNSSDSGKNDSGKNSNRNNKNSENKKNNSDENRNDKKESENKIENTPISNVSKPVTSTKNKKKDNVESTTENKKKPEKKEAPEKPAENLPKPVVEKKTSALNAIENKDSGFSNDDNNNYNNSTSQPVPINNQSNSGSTLGLGDLSAVGANYGAQGPLTTPKSKYTYIRNTEFGQSSNGNSSESEEDQEENNSEKNTRFNSSLGERAYSQKPSDIKKTNQNSKNSFELMDENIRELCSKGSLLCQ